MVHVVVIPRTAETPTSYLLPACASISRFDSSGSALGLLVISDRRLGSSVRHFVSRTHSVHGKALRHECSNRLTGATDCVLLEQGIPLCLPQYMVATVAWAEA
jgi:hypothetical protein